MTAALVMLGEDAAFGEAAAGAEAGAGAASDIPAGLFNLGNGHKMQFSSEQFRQLLHSAEVVAAIRERTQGVCDECNDTKKKKRALYEVIIQNESWTTRARGFVRPANAAAHFDDAVYGTMLKAAANAPNDPKMGGQSAPDGTANPTPAGEDDGTAAGEAAMADAAGLAEEAAFIVL